MSEAPKKKVARKKAATKKAATKKAAKKTTKKEPAKKKATSNRPSRAAASNRKKGRGKAGRRASAWTWFKRLLVAGIFFGSLGLFAVVGFFSYYSRDLPTVEALERYDPPQITRVVDRDGRVISELFEERRTVVPMEQIPRVLVLSVLAAEDADFYRHRGLDYAGILRALIRDVITGRAAQGASTITQQLVKNVLLTPERTIARKARELILARRLEQELDKDEILHLYLNHIYFGHGRYGVQEAARFYFGKDVQDLDLAEASLIAGLPQAPARLSPIKHPERARKRQGYVLDQLEAKRAQYWPDLTQAQIDEARKRKVPLHGEASVEGGAPEVATLARRALEAQVGKDAARHGGYRVQTTIDLSLQQAARRALREGLATVDARKGWQGPLKRSKRRKKLEPVESLHPGRTYDAVVKSADDATGEVTLEVGGHRVIAELDSAARQNPERLPASEFAPEGARVRVSIAQAGSEDEAPRGRLELGPQGAVVVIDPRTREVLALVGGDEAVYGFNRAVSAVRQPGSTFKPITYGLALETRKYTPATLVLDAPEVFDKWKPDNYETWNYSGAVRLREGVARSINLVAVRVMNDLGPEKVADFAHQLGITTELDASLALALGASGVRPVELVNAYATFAAGGRWAPYRLVRGIEDADGAPVELPRPEAPRDVLSPAAAYVLTSMLQSVVQEGTARAARKLGRPAAGKTGTSNNARDAWFVGYTPELVVGVWVGFDDHRPLGRGESGGKTALPIWIDVVEAALDDRDAVEFPVPAGVEHARIDPKSGLLAYEGMEDALDEVFVEGTVPTETATPPDVLDTSSFLMEQLGGVAP
ncbi:MAG: PBP1A family penicillin-binding protein [Myxococcales bacterium]|jgi:penicillin-binding protein 1A